MLQRNFFSFVFAVVAAALPAVAQITIEATDMLGPGYSTTQYFVENVSVTVGSAGGNQTWTIPAYAWHDTALTEYVDPASTVFASVFPTATRAEHSWEVMENNQILHSYLFQRIAADGWFAEGIGMQMDQQTYPMVFDPEIQQAPLPFSMGTSWTNVRRTDVGGGVVEVDSTLLSVDGWGTLNTPYGSYAVLRVAGHAYEILHSPGGTQIEEDYNYTFVDEHGELVCQLESGEETGNPNFTIGNVSVRTYGVAAVEEPARGPVAATFAVDQNYPNPFNPTTVLPVELQQTARVTLDIYDATGRVIAHEQHELSAGRHSLPIDGSAWATGTYFARVSTPGTQRTVRMQLVK